MRPAYAITVLALVLAVGALIYVNRNFSAVGNNEGTIINSSTTPVMPSSLSLTSSEFVNSGKIPPKYTCDGDPPAGGVNPPLQISGVPGEAKSLVLIMDDPDVPKRGNPDAVFDHWILFNIPPQTSEIAMGMTVGVPGRNSAGKVEYAAPCPPREYEPSEHRYFFKLYSLDSELSLPAGASKSEVEKAMEGHVLAETQLIGRYERQ